MAQALADHLRVHAGTQQVARARVAEVVEPDARDAPPRAIVHLVRR